MLTTDNQTLKQQQNEKLEAQKLCSLYIFTYLCSREKPQKQVVMNFYRNIASTTKFVAGTTLVLLLLCVACSKSEEQQNNDSSDLQTKAEQALQECEEIYLNIDAPAYDSAHVKAMHDYYMDSDEHDERARALFICAQHSYTNGNMAEALLYLIEAEKSTQMSGDKAYEGRIRRMKGDIYGEGCLFANALEEYQRCGECFADAGMTTHAAYALYDEGVTLVHMRDYDKASELLYATLEYAANEGALGLYYGALHYLLDIAIYTNATEDCTTLLTLYNEADSDYYNVEHKRFIEAVVAAHNGDMAHAELLLNTIDEELGAESIDDYYHTRYLVYRIGGNNTKAIEWLERGKSRQDMLTLSVLNQPTLNIELELLQSRLEAERTERDLISKNMEQERQLAEAQRQHTRTRIIWVSAMLLIATTLIIIYVRYRWQAKNRAIAQYIETIRELQMTSRDMPNEMNVTINTIYRDRFSELNALCETYYDHSGSTRQKNLVFNQLSDTIESIKGDNKRLKEMEEAVNNYRNNLMQRLRNQVDKLNERDLRVALYVFAGFSNRAIAIFIDSDPTNVSKVRYNIKQKIKNSNAEDGDMLIQALSEK